MNKNRLLQMSVAVVDLVYWIDCVPPAGTNKTANGSLIAAGGGFNAMVAAKRAGMDVAYGGPHGTGLFADIIRRELATAGIPLLQPQSVHSDQGSCIVLVDDQGERTFISKGCESGIVDCRLLNSIDAPGFGWILMSGYELLRTSTRDPMDDWFRDMPFETHFIFDPSPVVSKIPEPMLAKAMARASLISANLGEAMAITGAVSAAASVEALGCRVGKDVFGAVVRCGADGCWVAECGGTPIHVPGYAVDTIDTNGAGDTHVGASIAALGNGASLVEAAIYANAAAALSTMQLGPSTAPRDAMVKDFLCRQAAANPRELAMRAVTDEQEFDEVRTK